MRLSHRIFCTVYAVFDEFTEKRESDGSRQAKMLLAFLIDQIQMVAGFFPGNVYVFTDFNRAFRAGDECTAISPCRESVRCKPVDFENLCGSVIADQCRIA